MGGRCLLYLDSDHLSAWHWRSGQLVVGPVFATDEAGQDAFSAWIANQLDDRFTLIADAVEEGFQLETIPHVLGPDRRALISRKQNQLFYGSPYATTLSLGRERSGRRDERLLFAALTRPAMLEPWMQRLRAAGVAVTGITSVALLAPHLMRTHVRSLPRLLLVCRTPAGIRQTLFDEGRLRFSRLSALSDTGSSTWIGSLPFEVQKTYQYLVAQRAIARGSPLQVMLLASPADLSALRDVCNDSEPLHYTELDLGLAAKANGLVNYNQDGSDALPLFLSIAARQAAEFQFAPETDRRAFRWWQARRAVLISGAVTLLASILFAGKTLIDARRLDEATIEIRLDAQARQLRYERLIATLPRLPATLDALQSGVAQLERIEALAAGMTPAFIKLSQVLSRHPDIEIQRLEWSLTPTALEATGLNVAPASSRNTAPVRTGAGADNTSQFVLQARFTEDAPRSQRESIELIERLVEDLRREGASDAAILRLPVDFTSERTLHSSSTNEQREGFSLRAGFPQEGP